MHPILFQFDFFGTLDKPISLSSYGMMLSVAFVLSVYVLQKRAPQAGLSAQKMMDMSFWVLIGGVLGARILYILTRIDDYLAEPALMFKFARGGLVFYGAALGGAVAVVLFTKRHRLPVFRVLDLSVASLALAHGLGRIGCVFAGCCYGRPTDAFWGLRYPAGSFAHEDHFVHGLVLFGSDSLPTHPVPIYEASFEFLMFIFLWWIFPRRRYEGMVLAAWLFCYGLARVVFELYRGDSIRGLSEAGFSTSQVISLFLFVMATGLVLTRKWRPVSTASS